MHRNLKFGRKVFELCEWTDRQRHTHRNRSTSHRSRRKRNDYRERFEVLSPIITDMNGVYK